MGPLIRKVRGKIDEPTGGCPRMKKGSNTSFSQEPDLLVGLDLGTSKVVVVVAERDAKTGEAQIIGVGQAPSHGIRKGLIVNLDHAVQAIRQAKADAENMVGLDLREATVAFSGSDMASIRSKGMVSLGRTPRQVMQLDVERVIEAAQTEVSVPANQSILHTIPVEYSLDGHGGIDDPLGMTGMRLEIDLQSVIVPTAVIQNVLNCVERAGFEAVGLLVKPLASALGVLSPEEETAGAVVVDVGGGTTGLAVFSEGRPRRLALIPVGGDHITNDLACVLRIPLSKAEEIKKEVSLFADEESLEETLEFEIRGRTYVPTIREVTEVIRCRIEELFDSLVRPEIAEAGISMLPAGIVLTGGVAKTRDAEAFVQEILQMPARLAYPVDANRMPPGRNSLEYAAGAGIIRYVMEKERNPLRFMEPPLEALRGGRGGRMPSTGSEGRERPPLPPKPKSGSSFSFGKIFDSIRRSFRELF
jgi:cell division protein FtsA